MRPESEPSIALAFRDPRFLKAVERWPHFGFRLVPAIEADEPRFVCFGPDTPPAEFAEWRMRFPRAVWLWAKESWDADQLSNVPANALPGYFISLDEPEEAAAVWSKALRALATSETRSRKDLRAAGTKLESLMEFIKAIAGANNVFELLARLRAEMRSFQVVGDPTLLLAKSHSASELFYFRGKETFVRSLTAVPLPGHRVRIHDPDDRQFLANQMGRPFGKVIAFPLAQEKSSGWQIHPTIFFEHRMEDADLDRFIDDIGQRLQAASLALDRLVIETELKRSSLLWEETFDGIEEPIAIVGLDEELVRFNRHFLSRGLSGNERGLIKNRDGLFRVERFDIRIKDQGPVLSTVVHYHDVTKPMNLRERMIQLEKISAIGHLAGHIAHELNNPLTGVRSLAQFLIQQGQGPERVLSDLREVEQATERCQKIILNLLEFAKGTLDSKTSICDLNEIVNKTLPFLKSAMGRFGNEVRLQDSGLFVDVEPQLMQQVVFNLVNNACQALTAADAKIEIETSETAVDGKRLAVFSVKDNGPGVPKELQARIFEPFFTTKKEGQGTGLGLSFSRDFVRRLGGDIVCVSEDGRGAEFRVLLPLSKAQSVGEAS